MHVGNNRGQKVGRQECVVGGVTVVWTPTERMLFRSCMFRGVLFLCCLFCSCSGGHALPLLQVRHLVRDVNREECWTTATGVTEPRT
eukprot:1160079-Pelagomonas_calceolata.AAC.13